MEGFRGYERVLGVDVGKSFHWACLATRDGELLLSEAVDNRAPAIDELLSRPECAGALVVVDQPRNIGELALARAREAGMGVAYLPGYSMRQAARLFPGSAKTDERDALVIARTALGMPDALRPAPEPTEEAAAARALASQRDFLTRESTSDRNRLRSLLLEECPEFESAADLDDAACLRLLEEVGGPAARVGALTRGADRGAVSGLVAAAACAPAPSAVTRARDRCVRQLARRVREDAAEVAALDAEVARLLEGDETYRCLLTVPGIGPKTASELAISIDVSAFAGHDQLASYCGLAPRNRQSGTSISSVSASRGGNKRLKNLLIFSCNSLTRSKGRWRDYYDSCRARGMCHVKALKAVARKRMKVIYAVMRDRVPYAA